MMKVVPTFKILVVDDEATVCDLLIRTGRKLFPQARFISTPSAEQTLAYLDQDDTSTPDLVLLDLDLQSPIDGLALLPQLHERFRGQVPVVMLSACQNQRLVYEAYDKGAVAYTEKPSDLRGWKDYVLSLKSFLNVMAPGLPTDNRYGLSTIVKQWDGR